MSNMSDSYVQGYKPGASLPIPQMIWDALVAAGATPVQAAGIMGNMMQESSLNPEEQVMDSNGYMSRGLVMWNDAGAGSGVTWSQYITGNIQADIVAQVNLLVQQGALGIAVGNTPQQVAANFMNGFERPAAASANLAGRQNNAASVFAAAQNNGWNTLSNSTGSGAHGGPVGNTSSSAVTPDITGQQAPGGPPPLSDVTALEEYVRENFGSDAWLLNIPGVSQILLDAVAAGDDAAQIQAKVMQTSWWKTTSQSMQTYAALVANTPAEVNFNIPGSQASQKLADVQATAATAGVTLSTGMAQQFALDMMKYGWDTNQLKAAIGDSVYLTGTGAGMKTDAGSVIAQLQQQAGQYFVNPTDPVLQSWAQNIAAGTQTIQQFDAYLKQYSSLKWTGMAGQIQQGYTPYQITSSLRNDAAQLMEVDPTSIDFVNNPLYSKILDYAPGDSTTGVHRIMTQSEMEQYLKGTPQWDTTQNARNDVGTIADTITTTLGKVAG